MDPNQNRMSVVSNYEERLFSEVNGAENSKFPLEGLSAQWKTYMTTNISEEVLPTGAILGVG